MPHNEFASRMRALRKALGLTLEQVGNVVGVGKSTVRKWETGEIANLRRDKIAKLAEALRTTPGYLMGWEEPSATQVPDGLEALPPRHTIPVLGSIACGTPITAEENVEDYVSAPVDLACHFALRCKGDSMAPRILDGDLVYIRKQEDVTDGQIAAVVIDDEATLKHVYHIPNGVQLVSDNPRFRPLTYVGETCEGLRIVGLAVAYQRMLV